MATKRGQYPGKAQPVLSDGLAPATSVRGTDPALAGHYVRTSKSTDQGPTPGKTQVRNPNEPLAAAPQGGQFPGVAQPLSWTHVNPGTGVAGSGPQARDAASYGGGQYPGIAINITPHGADSHRSIMQNEGSDLNVREINNDGSTPSGSSNSAPKA